MEIKNLQNVMVEAEKELAITAWNVINKEHLLLEIKKLLCTLYETLSNSGTLNEKQIKELKLIISKIKPTDEEREWTNFQKHFNLLHSDFFKKIKRRHPSLSVSQIKLCGLIKMKMSTKEMANYLNLSIRGIETQRYRLRKKMWINNEISLEEYFDSFEYWPTYEYQYPKKVLLMEEQIHS